MNGTNENQELATVPFICFEFYRIEAERRLKRYRVIAVIETVTLLALAFYHYFLS